jgi:hypothetical protein
MKKISILFIFSLIITGLSYGQFAAGVKIGYNANKLTADPDSIKSQFNSGFHVGIWTHFGKRFYVAPALHYSMSGAVFTREGKDETKNWKQKVKIGSLDIPVLVGFKLIHSDLITWRLELGPEASFVINKKVEDENSVTGPIEEASINNMNWYVMGGTGVDVLFLSLDLRYKYGLNNVVGDAGTYQFDAKNQMFVVSLGFKILGKK